MRYRLLFLFFILLFVFSARSVSAADITVTSDTTLTSDYNILTVGGGTSSNWVDVNLNGHTVTCVKMPNQYGRIFNGTVAGCNSHTVFIKGQHIIVENITVRNGVTENNTMVNGSMKCGNASNWGSGIKAEKGSSDVLIRNNKVYENCGEGIDTTMASFITIENNLAYDNFSYNYYADNSNDIIIRNNIGYYTSNTAYYRNGAVGGCALVGAEDYRSYGWTVNRITNFLIEGNKFENCGGIKTWNPVNAPLINVIIRNNTFYDMSATLVNVSGATTSNNVLLSGTIIGQPVGTPAPTVPPTTTPVPNIADQEPDGDVDGDDFNTLVSNFGLSGIIGWIRSDILKNGIVDIFDFNKLISNFGL